MTCTTQNPQWVIWGEELAKWRRRKKAQVFLLNNEKPIQRLCHICGRILVISYFTEKIVASGTDTEKLIQETIEKMYTQKRDCPTVVKEGTAAASIAKPVATVTGTNMTASPERPSGTSTSQSVDPTLAQRELDEFMSSISLSGAGAMTNTTSVTNTMPAVGSFGEVGGAWNPPAGELDAQLTAFMQQLQQQQIMFNNQILSSQQMRMQMMLAMNQPNFGAMTGAFNAVPGFGLPMTFPCLPTTTVPTTAAFNPTLMPSPSQSPSQIRPPPGVIPPSDNHERRDWRSSCVPVFLCSAKSKSDSHVRKRM